MRQSRVVFTNRFMCDERIFLGDCAMSDFLDRCIHSKPLSEKRVLWQIFNHYSALTYNIYIFTNQISIFFAEFWSCQSKPLGEYRCKTLHKMSAVFVMKRKLVQTHAADTIKLGIAWCNCIRGVMWRPPKRRTLQKNCSAEGYWDGHFFAPDTGAWYAPILYESKIFRRSLLLRNRWSPLFL